MVYSVPDTAVDKERLRHRHLAAMVDPETFRLLEQLGAAAGRRCLEVGMGGASVAAWLAERVGASGEVWATDVDLRLSAEFVPEAPAQLQLRQHDILSDPLPEQYFDLVHARALLEHLPDPDQGLANMVAALRPGGWILVEGSHWSLFDSQPLPEPFAEFMRMMRSLSEQGVEQHRRDYSAHMLAQLQRLQLRELGCSAHVWPMCGGEASLEWLILALEWALPSIVEQGLVDAETASRAIAQARQRDFMIMSPTHISVWGQLPD